MRIVLISGVQPVIDPLVALLRELGHDVAALLAPRRDPQRTPSDLEPLNEATLPGGLDVLLVKDKHAIEPLLRAYAPDLMLCWGLPWKIPDSALRVPRHGSVNLHPGPLPRHRGPIPFAWVFRNDEPEIGVTWHYMDAELDTGNVLARATVPVEDSWCHIRDFGAIVSEAALALLPGVLDKVQAGDPGEPQDDAHATWAGHFQDDEYAEIDWASPARTIHNQVRAWNLTFGLSGIEAPRATLDGRRVRVLRTSLVDPGGDAIRVETGDGPLWVVETAPLSRS